MHVRLQIFIIYGTSIKRKKVRKLIDLWLSIPFPNEREGGQDFPSLLY